METVREFLKKCGVYYLATMEGDQPRVRPFGVAEIFEGKLYFLTGKRKTVSRQMLTNPKIEISALSGDTWIRVEALAVEDDRLRRRGDCGRVPSARRTGGLHARLAPADRCPVPVQHRRGGGLQ